MEGLKYFSVILVAFALVTKVSSEDKFVGKLSELDHGVKGKVYIVDESTIKITDFYYDGTVSF